jgi:hypothetical protein
MKISNYLQFINEDLVSDLSTKISDKNKDIKEDLVKMIQKSINSEDPKLFNDFIESFVRNPEDSQIEGLINDSDVYDFYLKYRNQVDEILSEIKFYENKPSDIDSFGLYDFIIKGTKKAIEDLVSDIKGEISGKEGEEQSE